MGKIRKGKILVIAILMMIASFFAFTGKVNAYWESNDSDCRKANKSPRVHYYVEGREVNKGDPGLQKASLDVATWNTNWKDICTTFTIPGSYFNWSFSPDTSFEYSSNKHIVRSLDGKRGVIAWYDNPEFEGNPVVDLYPAKNYWDKDVYLYGKMGEIINIYVNGREKTVVVGKKYSPSTLETDYVVQTGAYIYDDNRPVVQKGLYATDVEFFENANPKQETQNRRLYYFRDVTQKQSHANIVPQTPYKLYVDNTEFLPLLDYTTCKNYNGVSCSAINPETGEVFDYNYLLENHLTDLNSVPIRQTRNISKYYKYVGFVDSEGNEYEDVFEMKKEYEGKNFTPLVESKMSCTRIGAGYMNYAFSLSKINNMDIESDGDILTGDFNPEYMTHKKGYSADSEDYPDGKIGLMISTCIPQDVYIKKTYTFSKNIETEYSVVMEGTSGEKVKKGTKYVLPTEGKPKAAEAFTVTLKYQDNKTADETLSYTKIYTPNGFIIDGVHYDFGSSFIVEKDTYIYYDYDYVVVGPDLPTDLTRENYIFKGWYDAISGGHIVEDARTNTSSVLYAQWLDKDKVYVTRPDGITIELYKGTNYTLPDIPYKDESYIAKVAFYRNDGTGTKTFSDVVIYYEKNGMTCKETGVHYNVGQTIVVNENITFVGDYNERIKPATFPNDPIRDDYEFVGWFDEVEGGQQYTEYSGNKDLALYAHWQETSSTVTIKYVSDERVDIEMHDGKPAVMKKNIFEVEKNSIYQLEKVPNDGYQFFITAVYQDGKTPNETNKYSIGWARKGTGWLIDGVHYDSNEVIIADRNMIAHWEYAKVFQFLNFPEDPTRPGYKFLGWYDDPNEGTKYTTYDGFYPITLYAHWEKINEEYILPEITAKNPETVATVTLKFQDGITKDKKKYVKKNYVAVDYTVNGGEYNNEHFNVGDTINLTNDVTITPNYEEQIVEVELYSATRDGYMFAGWYDEEEGGTRYYNYSGTEDITLYAQWTTEPIANVCRRATTLHKSGNKTYGNLGTPGSLVPGDAFDCDVNGDGIYDPETERFYYINDLWDAENDTFVESVASLVYYADYYNGPLSSSSKDGFVKYSNTVPNDGPNVAATILPTTDEWSNVSLYKTVRQLSWPANGKTNSNGPLGTYDYSGYAARMVHGMELFQSGCLYSYNNKIMAAYYNLNNSCEFLTENIRRAPDGRKEDAYWIESPGGYCPNGYCPTDRAFPDFNKYAWALIKKSSSEYSSYMYQSQIEWSRGVRPVIDVPKTSMEDVPEHTIYHTITYPEGQEQVSLHGSTFVFGDVMSGPETEKLASVKFYPESGIMYEEFVERTTIPTAYKIGNTRYDKGSELLVLDDYQLEYIYVETLKPVEFPEDPTRSGYIFKGWYDAPSGGNEYTSYSGEEDLTLYARWEPAEITPTPIPEGTLCVRATELHTGTVNGEEVTFGNLGTLGELHSGDAFTCDINGDGDFDELTERFYYVSDYYDTEDKAFDSEYATLIYAYHTGSQDKYTDEKYEIENSENAYTGNGPTTIYNSLPSISDWSNSSLKTLDRSIAAVRGTNLDIESDDWVHSWKEETIEQNPECTIMPAEGYEDNVCEYQVVGQEEQETNCRDEETNCREEGGWDDPEMGYMPGEWVCDNEYVCDHEMVDVWDNVCETVWVETNPEHEECHNHPEIVYIDHSENVTVNYATFTYYSKAARLLNAHELSSATGLTNFVNNSQINISGNEYLFESGNTYFLENPYDPDNTWSLYMDGTLKTNEVGTESYKAYAVPVIDVPKDKMEVNSFDRFHTITYPDGKTEIVEHGTKWTFPKNKSTKEDEEGAIVTFDYQNGDENTTARVTKQFIASGWTIDNVHYNDGKRITIDKDITLAYDYVVTYVSPEFPTGMTKDGYTFSSWFDAPAGGTRYETYTGDDNITLYAHWIPNGVEPISSDILCKRATTLHTEICQQGTICPESTYNEGATVVYGTLGTDGELNRADAFDCDVNGDGIFDAETERFYYVSDYYDTENDTFDSEYATLLYYTGYNFDGTVVYWTDNFIDYLPTTNDWNNVSLKETNRKIVNTDADNIEPYETYYNYSGKAARLLTFQELNNKTLEQLRLEHKDIYDVVFDGSIHNYGRHEEFFVENTIFTGHDSYGYILESIYEYDYAEEVRTMEGDTAQTSTRFKNNANANMDLRLAIDVPKSRMEISSVQYHSVTYPDGFVEIVEHGTEIVLPSIPDDMIINATVTFKPENGESDIVRTSNKSKIYNGLLIDNELYEARTSYTVNKDIVITIDYEETDIPVEFPEDPAKEGYTFLGWYTAKVGGDRYTEYDGNEDLTLYAQYSKNDYVLPNNNIPKDSEVNSTVTFKYHNGNPDTTANVIKYYKQHGWLVDGIKHPNGDILETAEGAVIEPNYDTFYMNVEFPENPTKEGYQFIGWYTEETGGELVTVYNGSEDITLHAHYSNKNSYLLNGTEFYNKVSALSTNTRAKDFRKATSEEYEAVKNTLGSDNIVSIAGSPYDTFAWLDGNTFLYYSEADTIFAHEYCDGMFYSTLFDNVDVSGINFINTTSMNSMFANVMGSKNLTGFNTSKVTSMRDMFAYNRVAPDLSSFDTSHVTNMREMFFCTYYSNIDVSNFDTHNVTNMDRMFAGNGNNAHSHFVTLDLRNFDTGNVTTVNHMFYHTRNLQTLHIENFDTHNVKDFTAFVSWSDVLTSVDVTNFDTSNATTMAEMFRRLYSVTELDLSSFDTSKVTSTRIMFEVSNNLKTIYVSRGWDVSNANGYQMFKDDIKLVGQRGTTFDSNHIDNKYAVVDLAPERPGYLTFKGYYIITYPDGTKIEVEPGSVFTFPTNNDSKDSVRNAKVTFKYNDGVTPDYESYVGLDYVNDGWKVGNKYYQDGEEIVVNSDLTLEYNNVETATGARFPSDPTKAGHRFKGWYDAPAGGDKYTTYNDERDITLYAQWIQVGEGEDYNLGVNDIEKNDDILSTVTFKYMNGNSDTTSNVVRTYKPYGWLVDGIPYPDNVTVTKFEDTVIVPNYKVLVIPAEYPENPTKENYEFMGWYDSENDGKLIGSYSGESDITLYAHYTNNYAYLIDGSSFNDKLSSIEEKNTENSFRMATQEEYNNKRGSLNTSNVVSTNDSPNTVYLWRTGTEVLYYSEADIIFMNDQANYMFRNVATYPHGLTSIELTKINSSKTMNMKGLFVNQYVLTDIEGLENLNTQNVTDMSNAFQNLRAIKEIDLSNWNTSNVTTFQRMLYWENEVETINVSGFDTSSATDMQGMFQRDVKLSNLIGYENFDTSNVTDMSLLFAEDEMLTSLDLNNWDTSNVTTMYAMFASMTGISNLDLSLFDTSKVRELAGMFRNMPLITTLDLSSFDTSSTRSIIEMVRDCTSLKTIYVGDKWDVSSLPTQCDTTTSCHGGGSRDAFKNAVNLVGQNGTTYDENHVMKEYAIVDDAPEHPGYLTYKGYRKTYTITYPDGTTETVPAGTEFKFPSNVPEKDSENIATVTFKPENDTEDIIRYVAKAYVNPGWMIEDTHYDIGDIYVVNSDITLAYDYIETIEGVRFPSNPTKEGYIFDGWYNGNTKYISYNNEEDITLTAKWNIEIPTSGEYVLPENNTPKENEAISTILFKYHNGNPDTVTNVLRRFVPNGWLVNGVHKDAGEIINITKNTVIEPDYNIQIVNGEFPSNPTKTGYRFMGWFTEETDGHQVTVLNSLTDITVHAQYTDDYAFMDGSTDFRRELTNILSNYTYSAPGLTFRRATPEEYAVSSNYDRKNVKSVSSSNNVPVYIWFTGDEVLYGSSASTIFLDTFAEEMFQITPNNPMASKFGTIDLSELNTTYTGNMRSMFGANGNLKTLILGDFDTRNNWNFAYMFHDDVSLETVDLSTFNTSRAQTFIGMFRDATNLKEIDVSHFDLNNTQDMRDMFKGCSSLESLDVSNWNTSNVQFVSGIFRGCSSLTEIDVTNWDTSNFTMAEHVFAGMPLLTELDLSHWDTSKIYQTTSMFEGDTNLKTIYVSDKWTTDRATSSTYNKNVFKNAVSIVGQEGTTYDANHIDVDYAHVDEGPTNPGYLTYKGPKKNKVTYPDGTSDSAAVGVTYTFRTNDSTKEDEDIAVVTFKPSNGEEDITVNVTKSYTANGWKHNNSHINSGQSMKIEEDMVLTYDYTETINNITFPADPVKEDYTFVGWFDSRTGGTMYTSYNGENDLTLYARYSTDKPEPGTIYNLGVNNTSKADTTATVIFKYNDEDQTPDATMVISKQYLPSGWLVDGVHYDDNASVTYVEGMVIEPDYAETITSGTWPSDPTRFQYTFQGWFDSLSGGNKYTINDIESDITLYAHWTGQGFPTPIEDVLCYRARDISSNIYAGGDFGSLGTDGELNTSDAYICDVNGDGILDSNNERFYYLSDYYNGSTGEFDNTYATMVYSLPVSNGVGYEVTCFGCSADTYYDYSNGWGSSKVNFNGPITAVNEIPTTSQWPNATLFTRDRQIRTVDGETFIQGPYTNSQRHELPVFSYSGYAARMITIQEYNEGCNQNINSSTIGDWNNSIPDKCDFLTEGLDFWEAGPDAPETEYNEFLFESPVDGEENVVAVGNERGRITSGDSGAVKVAIDVPKDKIDLRVGDKTYTIHYPNNTTETVKEGTVFTVPNHNSKKNSVNGAKVTFKPENGGSDIIGYVTKKYVPNGFKIANNEWSTGTHYDIDSTITVNSDLYLKYDWAETYLSVIYPEDVIKAGYELDDWYTEANGQGEKVSSYNGTSNITLYANWTKKTSGKYTLPENTIGRNPEDVATVTFVYGNGKANTTSKVVATYTPNGWLVDGVHKDAGEVINMTPDIVLEPDYIRTVSPAAFPANPTRTNFVFKGWVDNENYNSTDDYNYYTTYDGGEDLTLYAKWETDDDHCSITYSDGEVKVVTCGTNVTVPTNVNTESETITFHYMYAWEDEMMGYVEKYETSIDRTYYTKASVENYKIGDNTYNVGESFTVNDDIYVERNLGNPIYDNTPFSVPDDAYNFVAWFTDWNDGVQVKSYYDYKSKGLTTHNLYGHYNDYESWEDPMYSVVVDGVEVGTFTEGTSYTAPAGTDVDEDLATVTLINGETTNTYKVHKTGTFNNYKVELGDSEGNIEEDGTLDAGSSITVNSNIFLTSQYDPETITGVDLPVLESNEYTTFKGWYKNENGSGPKYLGTYTDPMDITLYAYFDGKSAIVYYYADDTENGELIYTGNYKYGDTVDTSNMAVGATVNGKGILHVVYQNGTTDNDMFIPLEVTKQVDHWKDDDSKTYNKVYVVDFIGTKALTPVFGDGSVISYTLPDPDSDIYPGYTFTGWYTEPQGGTRITKITEDKDTTVYAHWTRNNDPVCIYTDGRTEECNPGDTKTVPYSDGKVVSRIYEVANGLGSYRDYIYKTIPVYGHQTIAYYEIDGTKYYPGDTYTIENNTTNIKPYYSSTTADSSRLDSSVEEEIIEEWFNNDGVARVLTGWYTERTGGDLVLSYDEAEDLYVYAHYEENTPDKEFYNVTFIDITNVSTTYSILKGTEIKLQNEELHQTASYYLDPDNGEEKMVGYIHASGLIDYEVNGTKYHANDIVTVNSDLTIKSVLGATNAERMPKDVPNPVKEGYVFTGWYINDNLYDMNDNSLENIAMIAQQTLVAHYEEYNPATDVIVDFDGDIRIVPKGTSEILPIKSTDWDYIEITFDSLRDYDDYVGIDVAKDLRDYTVNGESIAPGTEVTYMVDTVVRSNYDVTYEYDWDYGITYPELFDWSDRYSDFRGWSDAPNGGNIVVDASNIKEDTTLYAVYAPRYNLTVDGVNTQVPEGYIYTVPNGSTNGDSISFTLDYNYPAHDPVTKEVTIASGKGINYQLINGDRYDVSETYIVMGDTVVESITNNTDTITMIPEITNPSYEGYLFAGWIDPDRTVPVDIYSLTPEDKYYDGKTIQGYWQKEQDSEENVTLRLIDEYTKTNMQTQVPKGATYPAASIIDSLTLENTFNSAISNNINSDTIQMTVTTSANVSHFLYNGVRYENNADITFNEGGTLEVIRNINTTITCDDSECPEILYQKPNTKYNEYLFNGIFDNDDNLVDISKLEAQGSPYDDRYSNLTIKLTGLEDSIILTVDNEVSIIPKGMGNIPDAKTKASDVYKVTYDYNDGTNRKVSDNIVTRYTFEHYYVVGKGEFEAGTAYNYLENTTMNSVFSKETIYPEMRTIKTENFLGWFTEPHGGEEVTSLEGIDRDITLFARYNNDHVNIYIDNVANPVLYGEEFTLPEGTEKSDKSITFTLDYNYDNRTEDYTISTSFEFTGYEMDGNTYEPGYTFEATEDKYVTSQYDLTNVFTPEYTEPEREGYIFNGWFNGTEKVNVSELTAENAEINGKTLTASWTEVTPDDVVVTYDGEQRVVPIGTKLSELGDSPIKPSDETFTVYIDRNNGTFIIDTYEITKSYDLDKVYINGEELNENDYTFNEDTTVTTSYTASYEPNIFEGLTSDISGIFTEAVGGVKVENYDNVNDGDTLYYQYGETHTITVDGEVIATVPHGSEYTLPVNTKPRNMENIATVTFDYGYDKDPYITYVRKRFNSNGWSINGDAYANNEKITVNEDIVLEREYYETVQGIEFPGTPKRSGYRFNGWYYNDEEITSYNGTEDITITANWIKLIIITYLDDGSTEIVDAGTTKVFEPVSDTDEVFHNITFKYNYENCPEDKVVRISSHGHYVGWTINATDEYNDGDEITFNENSTVKARYEDVISNKNLPEDPVREGYDFLGWYDGKNIGNSNKVDITKIAKTMTVYGQYKVSGEHVVYFDGRKYTYNDETTVDTESLGFMSDTKENVLTLTLDYQNKSIENESIDYTIVSTFVNWTDEDSNTYGKVIDLANIPDGMHFTSNYDTEEFTPVDLSTYNPDIDDFLGWYTNKSGGEEVFTYDGNGDATYYAQYDEIKQVIVTIDNEVTIYSVGETFNLPENSIKSNDEIVITFDPQNGEEVFTKSIVTSYTFTGFRLDTDNELYQGETEFTANTDMTFTSEYTSNTTGDTWPSDPEKENYIFLGWYTNQTSGIEVFNFDGITSNTSLYAHYTTDDESFVTLTNTVTGESLKVQKSTDWLFNESKFNKDNKEKIGTITYKFNSTGYPDEVKDYYRTSTPTGYYIEGDDTLYNIDETHQFTSDTNITPYYGNVVTDSHVGIDQFDYEITNGNKQIKCFSKTNQDPEDTHDDEAYTCYENYDENDGDVTVYLHWKELKKITVTEPNGDTNEYTEGDTYNTGVNSSNKNSDGYTVTFKYQDGTTDDTTQEHRTSYTANGWLINGEHVDNNTDITLEEDLVKEYDYTETSTTITLPEPTRDDYTFAGWNSRANGKGITYDNDSINTLDKDTTVYAIWTKEEINITFIENGGSDVDDMTIGYDTPIGDLPTTSKENERVTENNNDVIIGYIFDGWYRDPEFTSKVSSTTTFTDDATLYAKWVEDRFPYVYPYHEENFVCTGSNYIDTGVKLYTSDNNDYLKDYEVGFTIESYNPSGQEKQAVFFNAKYENTNLGWPGLVFRRKDATNGLELTQTLRKNVKAGVDITDWSLPYKVTIYRIDGIVYYKINDGDMELLQDSTSFNQYFDVNAYFCAGDNGSGGIQRYVKGTISNYYVRMGDYQGTVDDIISHTVTYPDGSVEVYGHNTILELDANESTKASEDIATVTFKYHNGDEDTTSTVVKNYIPDGFIVNSTTHYDNNSTLVVDEDKIIVYDYTSENSEAVFPSDPVKENYKFDGWFTEEEGGDKVEYYDGDEDIILHAHYSQTLPTDISLDTDDITMVKGDIHQIEVTFTPDGTTDPLTYTDYDNEIISVVDGLVTALSKGETTITVGTENTNISKTITVTVLANELESDVYEVRDDTLDETNYRYVIGAEVGTLISEFKDNMLNPNEYIKIYDLDNNLVSDDDIVKTGLIIKLEINGTVYDEAIMIVRGDIDGDGLVDVTDKSKVVDHILRVELLEDYRFFAADVEEDKIIDVSDKSKIVDYILRVSDSLNE